MGIFRSTIHSESSYTSQPEDEIILADYETPNLSTEPSLLIGYESLTHFTNISKTLGETDDDRNKLNENDEDDENDDDEDNKDDADEYEDDYHDEDDE